MGYRFTQMKQHHEGELAISYLNKVFVLGAVNNWEAPIKQFRVCDGLSIEFLDRNLLLRGGFDGELEFIDYAQTGYSLSPSIQELHSHCIYAIQRIVKNIIVTIASFYGYLKVIEPISRKCYLTFTKCDKRMTAITCFY